MNRKRRKTTAQEVQGTTLRKAAALQSWAPTTKEFTGGY